MPYMFNCHKHQLSVIYLYTNDIQYNCTGLFLHNREAFLLYDNSFFENNLISSQIQIYNSIRRKTIIFYPQLRQYDIKRSTLIHIDQAYSFTKISIISKSIISCVMNILYFIMFN